MADAKTPRGRRQPRDAAFAKFRRGLLADVDLSLVQHERADDVCDWLTSGASSLTVTIVDGVMLVRYSGPVDLSFLLMGHAFAEGTGRWQAKVVVVVDFEHAVIAFDGDALDKALGCLSPTKMERPRALVSTAPHAGMFKDFALRQALKNAVVQRNFLDRERALAWANQYAKHFPPL